MHSPVDGLMLASMTARFKVWEFTALKYAVFRTCMDICNLAMRPSLIRFSLSFPPQLLRNDSYFAYRGAVVGGGQGALGNM